MLVWSLIALSEKEIKFDGGPVSPRDRRSRRLRVIIEFFLFLCLVGLTMVFLRPLQKSLNEKMVHLRDQLIAQGERALGRRIRYDSMGPSLFSTIDIRGIRVYSDEGDPFLRVKRLRIVYSPLLLLSGGEFKAIRSLILDTPEFSFVEFRDGDLIQNFSSPQFGGSRFRFPGNPQGSDQRRSANSRSRGESSVVLGERLGPGD